jgi:hypothetical protein
MVKQRLSNVNQEPTADLLENSFTGILGGGPNDLDGLRLWKCGERITSLKETRKDWC